MSHAAYKDLLFRQRRIHNRSNGGGADKALQRAGFTQQVKYIKGYANQKEVIMQYPKIGVTILDVLMDFNSWENAGRWHGAKRFDKNYKWYSTWPKDAVKDAMERG